MTRQQYRFSHRANGIYYWYATTRPPCESRVEQIRCSTDWYWRKP